MQTTLGHPTSRTVHGHSGSHGAADHSRHSYVPPVKPKPATVLLLCIYLTLPSLAAAEQADAIAFSAGVFDINEDESTEIGIEYRFAPLPSAYNLIPAVGLSINDDDAYWLYAGLRYDFTFADNWVLTPHIAASLYEDGNSKDLGSTLEFRSGLELAYRLNSNSHLGLSIYHLSNFDTSDTNPGAESVVLSYSVSTDLLN